MIYGIIAGGEGSRLAAEGVKEPKPLVKVGGESLLDRLVRVFWNNDAEGIVVAFRKSMTDVAVQLSYLQGCADCDGLAPVICTGVETPSSMHSLAAIIDRLAEGPFCVTTVDTVFREDAFRRYVKAFKECVESGEADGTARRPTLRLAMRLRQACGIAASVLAVAMLGTYLHGRTSITPEEQAALAQARTALVEFSATLNKGFDQMAAAQEKTAELNRKLSKCMEMTKTDVK